MGLKHTALLAMTGLCYIFLSGTIGSMFPGVFGSLLLARCSGVLSFLACIAVLVFFLSFLKKTVLHEQAQLRTASILVIIGLSFILVVRFKELLPLLSAHIFSSVSGSHNFDVLAPWLNSVFMVFFFFAFYRQSGTDESRRLRRAALAAFMGSVLLALLRTCIVWEFFLTREIVWFSNLPAEIMTIVASATLMGFLSVLYFFITFYREQLSLERS